MSQAALDAYLDSGEGLPDNPLLWVLELEGVEVRGALQEHPVEAPDGTIADDTLPSSKKTSDSIVGIPLLSKTCLDLILVIFGIFY